MQNQPVALITGANQGIGLQVAKDLAQHGYTVLVGSRDVERGEAAAREVGPNGHALQLDVTDTASIAAAAERVRAEFGRLDVLVQNAAISRATPDNGQSVEELAAATSASIVSLDEVRAVWETNVFGVLAVHQAMLPLIRQTPGSRIVVVSSGLGSLTTIMDPSFSHRHVFGPTYGASKTALNSLVVAMAIELESEGIKVSVVSPGFTSTALNNFSGTDTVEEGAREIVRVALLERDGVTGTFTTWEGHAIPW